MDEFIRDKLHQALDVEPVDPSLRTRVIASLPASQSFAKASSKTAGRWIATVTAAGVAAALVAALLLSRVLNNQFLPSHTIPSHLQIGNGTPRVTLYLQTRGNVGQLVTDRYGNVWAPEFAQGVEGDIVKINSLGQMTMFNIAHLAWGLAAGPDGSIWFTTQGTLPDQVSAPRVAISSTVGRISTTGTVSQFSIPDPDSRPAGITLGPDGNVWLVDQGTNTVWRMTQSGVFVGFRVPTTNAYPTSITVGPEGNLWFTEPDVAQIARITTSGFITEYKVADSLTVPSSVTAGPDGNLWITLGSRLPGGDGYAARLSTSGLPPTATTARTIASRAFTIPEEELPGGGRPFEDSGPGQITPGPDGNLWFTHGADVDRISTSGEITQFVVPATSLGQGSLQGITFQSDGALWFSETVLVNAGTTGYDYAYVGKLAFH